jgi:hypothetical protein
MPHARNTPQRRKQNYCDTRSCGDEFGARVAFFLASIAPSRARDTKRHDTPAGYQTFRESNSSSLRRS